MAVILTGTEIAQARERFDADWPYRTSWHQFMGAPHIYPDYDINNSRFVWPVTEAQAHKVRLLNSPHYKAILKAMAVQWREGVEHG